MHKAQCDIGFVKEDVKPKDDQQLLCNSSDQEQGNCGNKLIVSLGVLRTRLGVGHAERGEHKLIPLVSHSYHQHNVHEQQHELEGRDHVRY